jgi:hypothetical protein
MANEPKLRHEFVGMMFAITVGEIGLQTAAVVQAPGHWVHYLPAYSHLFLATFVVAASWVGWSRSAVPSAHEDVVDLFEWPFVVLLLDMAMVVTYFILVRTVDFSEGHHRIDSASIVAKWHVLIFSLYVAWDVVTKVFMYHSRTRTRAGFPEWFRNSGMRMVPTLICLGLSWWLWRLFFAVDDLHRLSADLALLAMVILFRALKGLISEWLPRDHIKQSTIGGRRLVWTLVCVAGLVLGTLDTIRRWPLPLPEWVIKEIEAPVAGGGLAPTVREPNQR